MCCLVISVAGDDLALLLLSSAMEDVPPGLNVPYGGNIVPGNLRAGDDFPAILSSMVEMSYLVGMSSMAVLSSMAEMAYLIRCPLCWDV
jgi:hypothetical protein